MTNRFANNMDHELQYFKNRLGSKQEEQRRIMGRSGRLDMEIAVEIVGIYSDFYSKTNQFTHEQHKQMLELIVKRCMDKYKALNPLEIFEAKIAAILINQIEIVSLGSSDLLEKEFKRFLLDEVREYLRENNIQRCLNISYNPSGVLFINL